MQTSFALNQQIEISGQSPCCCESLVSYKVNDVFEDWVSILDRRGHAGLFRRAAGQEASAYPAEWSFTGEGGW